jgi:hypothetical protein
MFSEVVSIPTDHIISRITYSSGTDLMVIVYIKNKAVVE